MNFTLLLLKQGYVLKDSYKSKNDNNIVKNKIDFMWWCRDLVRVDLGQRASIVVENLWETSGLAYNYLLSFSLSRSCGAREGCALLSWRIESTLAPYGN